MITLKKWNSLSANRRRQIANVVYGDMPIDYQEAAAKEFHHDFKYSPKEDDEISGRAVKTMLECCYELKDGGIKVVVMI